MTQLELEAEKYNKNAPISEMYLDKAFIAGATSKYVEKEKLQFAIQQIKSLSSMTDSEYFYSTKEGRKVEELEQKLKQL